MSFPSRKRKRSNLQGVDLDIPASRKRVCIESDVRIVTSDRPAGEFINTEMLSDMESFLYNGPDSQVRLFNPVYKKTTWFDYSPIVNKLSGSIGFGQKNVTISLPRNDSHFS